VIGGSVREEQMTTEVAANIMYAYHVYVSCMLTYLVAVMETQGRQCEGGIEGGQISPTPVCCFRGQGRGGVPGGHGEHVCYGLRSYGQSCSFR
jgi:hypothetical protein